MTHNKKVPEALIGRLALRHHIPHPNNLSDIEFLSVLLRIGYSVCKSRKYAEVLMNRFKSLSKILSRSKEDIDVTHGIPPGTGYIVEIIKESVKRAAKPRIERRSLLANFADVLEYLYVVMNGQSRKECRVLFLDACDRLIADEEVARGTIDRIEIYPRELFRRALEVYASGIIVAVRDPTGRAFPDQNAKDIYSKVLGAANVLSIKLKGFIIIGDGESHNIVDTAAEENCCVTCAPESRPG